MDIADRRRRHGRAHPPLALHHTHPLPCVREAPEVRELGVGITCSARHA